VSLLELLLLLGVLALVLEVMWILMLSYVPLGETTVLPFLDGIFCYFSWLVLDD